MEKRLKYYLLAIIVTAINGFLIALGTYLFIGEAAFSLPGGSIAAGCVLGYLISREYVEPDRFNFIYPVTGIFSGLIGFLIFLVIFV